MRCGRLRLALLLVLPCAGPAAAQGTDQTSDTDARRQSIRETVESLSTLASAAREVPTPKGWKPAKTPWGHPDIEGVFTNNDERLIPLERPAEFAGRRQGEFTPEELSKVSEARRAAQIERLVSEAPLDPGTIGWFEAWNARNSRAWLIVGPEDGRVPPLTPEGQRRAAARRQSVSQSRPIDRQFDRNFETRCISRGVPGSMMPAFYGSAYEIHQGPGFIAIRYELNHETRVIPLDGHPHVGSGIRTYMGDPRGRWKGGRSTSSAPR